MIYEAITDLIGFDTDANARSDGGDDQNGEGEKSIILTPEELGDRGPGDAPIKGEI